MLPDATRFAPPTDTVTTAPVVGGSGFAPADDTLEELGRGAMGVVYKATQPGLNRAVAVKMLLGEEASGQGQRFLAEAEAVAAVDHPHVVKVYEFGRRDGRPFLAMEYLPGGTLADKLAGRAKLPPTNAAELVRQLAAGVGAAHAAGVVHRDLKPTNVLFDAAGEPKVTDFGLAKRGTSDLTATNAIMGTPAYMAPEQARGDGKFVGPPADVWALGVILYEALAGVRPFAAAETWGLLQAVLQTEPTPVRTRCREVPRDLAVIVAKCLRKDAAERYATAGELAADLGRFLAGEPITAKPVGAAERALKWVRRKPGAAAGWGLGVIAAVSLIAVVVSLKLQNEAVTARRTAEAAEAAANQAREQADTARGRAEVAETEAKQARKQAEDAREQLARAEYARTVNLAYREYQRNDLKRADEYLNLCQERFRGWEWHYVHRLCHPEWEVIPERLASDQPFSADGMTFLTLKDGKVNVRHVEKGLVRTLDAGKETKWAALSPDAGTIATGDGKTCQLRKATGEKLREIKHEQAIRSGVFSADGKELFALLHPSVKKKATAPKGDDSEKADEEAYAVAAVWPVAGDAADPRVEWRIDRNFRSNSTDTKLDVKWSWYTSRSRLLPLADGRLVIDSSLGLELWSADGKAAGSVSGVNRQLAPGSSPNTLLGVDHSNLNLVDVTTGKPAWSVPLGTTIPKSLAAHPDGDRVTVGGSDGRVEVWSVKEKKRVAEYRGFPLGSDVTACRLSGDGRWAVAGASGEVRVWRTDRPAESTKTEVTLAAKELKLHLWKEGEKERPVLHLDNTSLRPVSSEYLFGPGPQWGDFFRPNEGVQTLRDRTTSRRFGPQTFFNADRSILYHERRSWPTDGRSSGDGSDENVAQRQLVGNRVGTTICHDADDLIAEWEEFWDEKNTVRIRTFGSEKPLRTLAVGEEVAAAAFARTGHRLFVVGRSGAVSAWDADTGDRAWATPPGEEKGSHSCLDVSPDGKRLATSGPDGAVLLLNADTGERVATLRGHYGTVETVRFSPDGRRLASHDGRELKVWDPDTGHDLLTLEGEHCDVLDFSADGTRLIASEAEETGNFHTGLNLDGACSIEWCEWYGITLGLTFSGVVEFNYSCLMAKPTERVFDARPIRDAAPK